MFFVNRRFCYSSQDNDLHQKKQSMIFSSLYWFVFFCCFRLHIQSILDLKNFIVASPQFYRLCFISNLQHFYHIIMIIWSYYGHIVILYDYHDHIVILYAHIMIILSFLVLKTMLLSVFKGSSPISKLWSICNY